MLSAPGASASPMPRPATSGIPSTPKRSRTDRSCRPSGVRDPGDGQEPAPVKVNIPPGSSGSASA